MIQIPSLTGTNHIEIKRVDDTTLELKIGDQSVKMFTEDLAAVVRDELPNDRAEELFAEMEERALSKGKMRVAIKAKKKIEKDETVVFTVDVNRYLDRYGNVSGVRSTAAGFIY